MNRSSSLVCCALVACCSDACERARALTGANAGVWTPRHADERHASVLTLCDVAEKLDGDASREHAVNSSIWWGRVGALCACGCVYTAHSGGNARLAAAAAPAARRRPARRGAHVAEADRERRRGVGRHAFYRPPCGVRGCSSRRPCSGCRVARAIRPAALSRRRRAAGSAIRRHLRARRPMAASARLGPCSTSRTRDVLHAVAA